MKSYGQYAVSNLVRLLLLKNVIIQWRHMDVMMTQSTGNWKLYFSG